MRLNSFIHRAVSATAIAAVAAGSVAAAAAAPRGRAAAARPSARTTVRVAQTPQGSQRPTTEVLLSTGQGELINLPSAAADVWVSNPGVADVYVSNPRQIHLFGKEFGEATVFATNAAGTVIYATNVRVSQNLTSIDKMMKAAMPEADIKVTLAGQIAVLTGTVASPDDSAQAARLAASVLNPGVDISGGQPLKIGVINRLRTATPLQVNLQVRFAEVNRAFAKNISSNLIGRDTTNGFQFGVASGRNPGSLSSAQLSGYPTAHILLPNGQGYIDGPYNPSTGQFINPNSTSTVDLVKGTERTTLGLAGKLFGVQLLQALDLGETAGQVTTLANPNLTALSGETGTFLAGGEIPIPVAQGLGTVSIEYKQYGVSLAYTPTVLSDGRISLRVRPEVSQLDYSNAITLNGAQVPGLTTRRAETTVELGSGQSFMIGGLIQNFHNNNFEKTPGVGDVPILGALFRSNAFQRNETELVIVITPYLVKPVNNIADIKMPTDGYQAPTDLGRLLLGQVESGKSGLQRPVPTMAAPSPATPVAPAPAPGVPVSLRPELKAVTPDAKGKKVASATPGFSGN
jgi:pilus assembly protein CpaC